ncbi:GDSL lipase/esterase [Halteromyces radiatus]|uniref:GDSL lipase/esterase n=1 Tax=Halteromyces radiatus TaxID=101107 RepID=UPI00221FBA08|nr:GDSL lipase/esterase [Halteromyces radiatus]KAI8086513.1 GDSL lipase/esterase [Halteromyces radiatus]
MVIKITGVLLLILTTIVSARFNIDCEHDPQLYPNWVDIQPCYEHPIHDVYIFGDSYSDNGEPILDQQYYTNHYFPDRYSNGPMCLEYIAKMLGSNLFNYAHSGATVDNSIVRRSTLDIHQQLELFRQSGGPQKPSDSTLYTFWIGTNDVEETFKNQATESLRNKDIDDTILSLYEALETLYHMPSSSSSFAARQILIMGLIPVDHMPIISSMIRYESQRQAMTDLVARYNNGLKAMVEKFNHQYGDATVEYYDAHWAASKLFNGNSKYFTSDSVPCVKDHVICNDENRHIWWDDYHPTTSVSYALASDMYHTLFA